MRRGIIVGLMSASLTVAGGCAGSPRWECASWDCDEAYVTEHEPEALYPAELVGGPLAAATRNTKWVRGQRSTPRRVLGTLLTILAVAGFVLVVQVEHELCGAGDTGE